MQTGWLWLKKLHFCKFLFGLFNRCLSYKDHRVSCLLPLEKRVLSLLVITMHPRTGRESVKGRQKVSTQTECFSFFIHAVL